MGKVNGTVVEINYQAEDEPDWYVYYDEDLEAAQKAVLAEAMDWFINAYSEEMELPDPFLFSFVTTWGRFRPVEEDECLDDDRTTHIWETSHFPAEGWDRVLRARYTPWDLRDKAEMLCRTRMINMAIWLTRAHFGPDVIIEASKDKYTFGTADKRAFDGKTPFGIRFDFPRPAKTKDGIRLSGPVLFYDVNSDSLACAEGMVEEWITWWSACKDTRAREEHEALTHRWHSLNAWSSAMGATDLEKWEMMLTERRLEKLKQKPVSV